MVDLKIRKFFALTASKSWIKLGLTYALLISFRDNQKQRTE